MSVVEPRNETVAAADAPDSPVVDSPAQYQDPDDNQLGGITGAAIGPDSEPSFLERAWDSIADFFRNIF